jgi:hypothetical protein
MPRKTRKDITVKGIEKKLGLSKGSIRNPSNKRKRREDATLEAIRKKSKK